MEKFEIVGTGTEISGVWIENEKIIEAVRRQLAELQVWLPEMPVGELIGKLAKASNTHPGYHGWESQFGQLNTLWEYRSRETPPTDTEAGIWRDADDVVWLRFGKRLWRIPDGSPIHVVLIWAGMGLRAQDEKYTAHEGKPLCFVAHDLLPPRKQKRAPDRSLRSLTGDIVESYRKELTQ